MKGLVVLVLACVVVLGHAASLHDGDDVTDVLSANVVENTGPMEVLNEQDPLDQGDLQARLRDVLLESLVNGHGLHVVFLRDRPCLLCLLGSAGCAESA